VLHWRSKGVVRGFFIAYGLLLLVAAVVLSGAGHGPFIVFRLVGAPLTAWNRFPGIGILAIWALLGELLVRGRRWLAGGLLAVHYVGVLVVLFGVEGQRTGLALGWNAGNGRRNDVREVWIEDIGEDRRRIGVHA
jgi:hypothetical protein